MRTKKKIKGRFCETKLARKSAFDLRSLRWKQSGKAWLLVGCPKGHFTKGVCRVGTKGYALLSPKRSNRCPVGARSISK